MNPLIKVNRRVCYLFIAFLITCFVIAQQAAKGEPPDLPKDTIILDFSTPELDCAPEKVRGSGLARLRFESIRGEVVPTQIELNNVRGKGTMTDRIYKPAVEILNHRSIEVLKLPPGGIPDNPNLGSFLFRFKMVGPPNPPGTGDPNPGKTFHFIIEYQVIYRVTPDIPGRNREFVGVSRLSKPKISCPRF